ncbi:MAG: hypothetical protein LBC87_09065 [Fibromonadaceae bacterium]|nr:hypothetical protein [Fibromonadaceae bacterium]
MLNLGGKCILVCIILLLCGFSFAATGKSAPKAPAKAPAKQQSTSSSGFAAQVAAAKAKRDSLARLDSLAKLDSIIKANEMHRQDSLARILENDRQDSIAKMETFRLDSIARLEAFRRDSTERAEAARREAQARAEEMARANAPPYPNYEAYLDSLEAYVRYLLPGIDRLDSAKKAISEETLKPKSDYESQASYEQRAANFDKNKQQKIDNLEKEYLEKEKGISKLVTAVTLKDDFQPDWGGLLEKNTNIDGYKARIDTIGFKINEMKVKIAQLNKQLGRLFLYRSDSVKIAKNVREKNFGYMARLDNAKILMQDYMLQDQAKVMRTDRKKVDMYLGNYDVDRQEFDLNARDIYSEKYPFDYVGKVKIPTQYAEIIDRKTDDFTVSIDYINFPFMVNGIKTFPGAKKAYVFWKDNEFENEGGFRIVPGYEEIPGFEVWALRADSLISGKLAPRDLDASFAKAKVKYKEDTGPSWWTTQRVVQVLSFTASAGFLVAGILQNSKASKKLKEVKTAFGEAEDILVNNYDPIEYSDKRDKYNKQKDNLKKIENMRNIFYISAGTFGVIGAVSFAF